jgi:hypothetical protein
MDYSQTTTCRADEAKAGEVLVRIGSLEYPDGLRLNSAPERADDSDRPWVFLPFEDRVERVPADRLVWVLG